MTSTFHKPCISKFICLFLLGLYFCSIPQTLFADEMLDTGKSIDELCPHGKCDLAALHIVESRKFSGLAFYYNNVDLFLVDKNHLDFIEVGSKIILKHEQWLAVTGRYNVLLFKASGLEIILNGTNLFLKNEQVFKQSGQFLNIVEKPELLSVAPELDKIRYAHLWLPFSELAKLVEAALVVIQTHVVSSWGLTLILFSLLLKLLLLPVGIMTASLQRQMSKAQSQLAPMLAEIKASYDGEEAHNRLMAAHKEIGVTPFYTLKPMLGSFIQIPVLIAVFNALGEMPQFDGQSFLWIENLAYPDAIGYLPFVIPMFGDTVSLLPFIMAAVTLFSTVTFQNRHASLAEVKRQKRNLYLMTAAFFVLFYPFPAVMVLYWTMNNLLHIIQQEVIKI